MGGNVSKVHGLHMTRLECRKTKLWPWGISMSLYLHEEGQTDPTKFVVNMMISIYFQASCNYSLPTKLYPNIVALLEIPPSSNSTLGFSYSSVQLD
jgi:hypothetical protein